MPLKQLSVIVVLLLCAVPASVPAQIDVSDSLVVREILDANGLDTVSVNAVVGGGSGRIYALYLDRRGLTVLPECLGKLDNLGNLQIQGNQLSSLPKSIGKLTKLWHLCAYENNLHELPAEIASCVQLETLYLIRNRFTKWPEVLSQLTRLQVINLGGNNLTEVPADIIRYQSLSSLSIYDNYLSTLPTEFLILNPEIVSLGGNSLCALSPEIQLWLESHDHPPKNGQGQLYQACNSYASDSSIVQKFMVENGWSNLAVADFAQNSPNGITKIAIPSAAKTNGLLALPADIGLLKNLRSFSIAGTRTGTLPANLVGLCHIGELDLSNNDLAALPDFITFFDCLTKLDVSGNRLKDLSPEVEAWLTKYDPDWKTTQQTTRLQSCRAGVPESSHHLLSARTTGSSVLFTVNFPSPTEASLYLCSFDGRILARRDLRRYSTGIHRIEIDNLQKIPGNCIAVLKTDRLTSSVRCVFTR